MVLAIVCFVIGILIAVRLLTFFHDKIGFFARGADHKFTAGELSLLWKLAKECKMEEPSAFFYSTAELDKCIAMVVEENTARGTIDSAETQSFLSKLYSYRTKVALEADKHRGLDTTRRIARDQNLRVVFPGHGVFSSKLLLNAKDLVVSLPKQDGVIKVSGEVWVGKRISVYLWRKNDACYVFDTIVHEFGVHVGQPALFLEQTNTLTRAQKRKSIRAKCNVSAVMFPLPPGQVDYNEVSRGSGYRCILEDISEDGAQILVGGKAKNGVQVKLQFDLSGTFVMMFGVVRSVDFDEGKAQSRLHFECVHLEQSMRNAVLAFVYNVLPQEQKDALDAIAQVERDAEFEPTSVPEDSFDVEPSE